MIQESRIEGSLVRGINRELSAGTLRIFRRFFESFEFHSSDKWIVF